MRCWVCGISATSTSAKTHLCGECERNQLLRLYDWKRDATMEQCMQGLMCAANMRRMFQVKDSDLFEVAVWFINTLLENTESLFNSGMELLEAALEDGFDAKYNVRGEDFRFDLVPDPAEAGRYGGPVVHSEPNLGDEITDEIFIMSEIATLEDLLQNLPEDRVIERISLESRLRIKQEELQALMGTTETDE